MAGLAAINEIDIKKVIALSTLSQLGVIIITLGLGSPHLSFYKKQNLYTLSSCK